MISEVGNWLSHVSIVAREHDVLLVVGVENWDNIANECEPTIAPCGIIEFRSGTSENFAILAAGS